MTLSVLAAAVVFLYLHTFRITRWPARRKKLLLFLLIWAAYIFALTLATGRGLAAPAQIAAHAPKVPQTVYLIPFEAAVRSWDGMESISLFLYSLLGNVVLFLPMGLVAEPVFGPIRPVRMLWIALSVPLGVELLQLLENLLFCTARQVDITDCILNAAGFMAGFYLCRCYRK